jgi:hypothetical protein
MEEFIQPTELSKLLWGLSIGEIFYRLNYLKSKHDTIDYELELQFLETFFEMEMLANHIHEWANKELFLSIYLTSDYIRQLISHGLYHSVYKLVDEISITLDEKAYSLKDQWKPFYLALKYLYQPEELEKQPSELKAEAFSLLKRMTPKVENPT